MVKKYKNLIISLLIITIAFAVVGWWLNDILSIAVYQEFSKKEQAIVESLASLIKSEMQVADRSVQALASDPFVIRSLASSSVPNINLANQVLDRYCRAFAVSVCYLMNKKGDVIASSNRNEKNSFVGKNYNFRPYFQQAIKGQPTYYCALGITSHKRGYYASFPVYYQNKIIGVAVIKKNLDEAENYLKSYKTCYVASPEGIIFLSGEKSKLFSGLWPIEAETAARLIKSRQFGMGFFRPIFPHPIHNNEIITFANRQYLVVTEKLKEDGWKLFLLTPTYQARLYILAGVISFILLWILVVVFLIFVNRINQALAQAAESADRLRQVVESSQDWIWETDRKGKIVYASKSIEKILGFSVKEVLGKYYKNLIKSYDRNKLNLTPNLGQKAEKFFRIITRRKHKSGEEKVIETSAVPFYKNGEFSGYRGIDHDITKQVKTEEALREHNEELERFGQIVVERELKMIELKKRLKELEEKNNHNNK